MPRQARIDIPGLLQHVIVRGVARTDIFLDDEDRDDLVQRLAGLLTETKTICLAWALLDNHVHLLLMPAEQPLAQLMRRLLTGYAVVFNLRHNRSGHLFQNRYKSIVCDADNYLLELVRYIHLNPVRAGIVNNLDELANYRWCGHQPLIGKTSKYLIQETELMPLFSKHPAAAVSHYLKFLSDGLAHQAGPKLSVGGRRISQALNISLQDDDCYDERVLGGGSFVEKVLARSPFATGEKLPLEKLISKVAAYYGIAAEELSWPCREPAIVRAKAIICYWATRRCRIPGIDVANRLKYSSSAVSQAAKRGLKLYRDDKEMQKVLEMD